MINVGERLCPKCGGFLKYYDSVRRIVKYGNGKKKIILLARYKCSKCKSIHREIPDILIPYKHYSSDIINKVISGDIDENTFGYEDLPCIQTMDRWNNE